MLLTPTRLAIIACTHMVPYYEKGQRMSVPEMEERFNINPRTINPALRTLVHAGILNSKTGGLDRGYMLARNPREITIYEIMYAIQGEPKVQCCLEDFGAKNCDASRYENGRCNVFNKLNEVMEIARREISKINLYDQYYKK
ncbi:MAG: Rrf2 family transcriptional regulator [Rikenellaceae bacterium]